MVNLLLTAIASFSAGYCFGRHFGIIKQKRAINILIEELEKKNAKMMNSFYLRNRTHKHNMPEDSFCDKN